MKKFIKLCLVSFVLLQIIPATSINVNAINANILDQNVVTLNTQHMPESVVDNMSDTLENHELGLEVHVVLDKNTIEEKTLVYKNMENPGKVSVEALDGYILNSMQLDGNDIENNFEIIYDSATIKKLTINVSTLVSLNVRYVDENKTLIKESNVKAAKGTEYQLDAIALSGYDAVVTNPTSIILSNDMNEVIMSYVKQMIGVNKTIEKVVAPQVSDDTLFYTGFYLLKNNKDKGDHSPSSFIPVDKLEIIPKGLENVTINNKSYGLFDGAYARFYGGSKNNYTYGISKSTLKNNPKAMNVESGDITKYFAKVPTKDEIDNAIRMNGSNPDEYEVNWYRIVDEQDGFHVDGYLTKKSVANVIFHNDGKIMSSISLGEGSNKLNIDSIPNNPTKAGYSFEGWYDNSEFKGKALTNEEVAKRTYTGTTHFYAGYIKDEYINVKFNLNDGSVEGNKNEIIKTILKSSSLKETDIPEPIKKGYNLSGWNLDNDDKLYTKDEIKNMKFNDSKLFTAQYIKDVQSWTTVTFNAGTNGSLSGTTSFEAMIGETLVSQGISAPSISANAGYLVATTPWNNDYASNLLITKNMEFTAQYTKNPLLWTTVTFNAGTNGSLSGTTSFEAMIGETLVSQGISAPSISANVGYLVATTPWNNDYAVDKIVSKDLSFIAQYQLIPTPVEPDPTPVEPTPLTPPPVLPVVVPPVANPQVTLAVVLPIQPATQQVETINEIETPLVDKPTEKVKEDKNPLSKGDSSSWALLNLVCSILTVLAGIALLFFKGKKENEDNEKDMKYGSDEEVKQLQKRRLWVRFVGVVIAITSVAIFMFTENMSNPMNYVDSWTLIMVILFVVEMVTLILGMKWKETTKK